MSDLELRTQAVHVWDTVATQNADEAIGGAVGLQQNLETYVGMPAVDHYVQAGLADVRQALALLRRARATIGPIVDARLAEERARRA